MRTLVGADERGRRIDRGVYLVLATAMPHELSAVQADPDAPLPVASAKFRPEAFRFSKSLEDGGAGQIARLIDFGRLLGRLSPLDAVRGPGVRRGAPRIRRGRALEQTGRNSAAPARCRRRLAQASPASSSASTPARSRRDPLLQGEAGRRERGGW